MHQYLMIGEVVKPQGIHGEAKIRYYTAEGEAFSKWDTLYLQDGTDYTPIAARYTRTQADFVYVTLGDCATPEDVEKLRGRSLFIDRAHAAQLEDGQVYIADLIGCTAVDENGETVGTVKDVLQNGAADVYVFRTRRGEMMAPALKDVFTEVDVEQGIIRVDSARLKEVALYED